MSLQMGELQERLDEAELALDSWREEVTRVRAERDRYRDALTALRDVLLRDSDHLAARRAALAIVDSLGLPS
jgi:hypothetical protein